MTEEQREVRRKKRVLEYADKNGNIKTACRRFGIARSTFYLWRDRYREAGDGQELYPDLILIDGVLGQLHAALEAFDSLDQKPPMVISLAKKEELIYVQERSEPIKLGRENLGLKLCQAIRDEAHRFAQHYHHILRRKSVLDEDDT